MADAAPLLAPSDAERSQPDGSPEPLRDRRRRELRQHLSDVATRMFLERGFDAVRVADIARACGVTEKTVFNHFRSKESLLVDRWDPQIAALRAQLADPHVSPVDAALAVLEAELGHLTSAASQREGRFDLAAVRRFGDLIQSTPALIAYNREALERLTTATAAMLEARTGTEPGDPESLITATAVAGLWNVYATSLRRHLATTTPEASELSRAVRHDLARAAATLRRGI